MAGDPSSANVTVRPATPTDAALVVQFVKALAKFEKEPAEHVLLTEESVRKHGFGDNPAFEVLFAEAGGEAIGMALFFQNFSTWTARLGIWVEELFVKKEWRGKGIGKRLMAAVAKVAAERGCGRVELAALKWNPATGFYRELGFEPLEEWQTFRLDGAAIQSLAEG